jgi:hypothetical protein
MAPGAAQSRALGGWPLAGLLLLALAHGLAYALIVPLWQMPDEPMLFEYAALTAELGRPPSASEHSPAVERRLLDALRQDGFWRWTVGRSPAAAPATLADAQAIFFMPRQVGGDPPVYFLLAALPLRLTAGWSASAQARLLRLLGALLLPASVLLTYLAARELAPGPLPLAAGALVALQPMHAFIGAAVSNDGLANALGAGMCWLLVRAAGGGRPWRGLAALAALTGLALLVKRSALAYLLIVALLAAALAVRASVRALGDRRRLALAAALTLLIAVAGAGWLAQQLIWDRAFAWFDASGQPAARLSTAAGPALLLHAGDELVQGLPAASLSLLRNNSLSYGGQFWGDAPASGRLVIYTDNRRQEYAFQVGPGAPLRMSGYIPTIARGVRVGIVADSGQFYASQLWARSDGDKGNLLSNGRLWLPAVAPASPLQPMLRYVRFDEVAWAVQSGRAGIGLELGPWLRWLFDSFWGHFGWMNIAFVQASLWEPLLALACAWGLLGAIASPALRRPGPAGRILLALLALLALAPVPALINALVDLYPIQQGRYLLPALAPLAIVVAYGQLRSVPAAWRPAWAGLWAAFWIALAGAALARLAAYYA